jgi:hypothetical protein
VTENIALMNHLDPKEGKYQQDEEKYTMGNFIIFTPQQTAWET